MDDDIKLICEKHEMTPESVLISAILSLINVTLLFDKTAGGLWVKNKVTEEAIAFQL